MATPQTLYSQTVTPSATATGSVFRDGGMATIAPLDAGATVAADVVKPYGAIGGVETDHGTDSLLHDAAKEAIPTLRANSRLDDPKLFAGAFGNVAFPAIGTLTFGASPTPADTGTLPASLLPFYDAGPVTFDGVAIDTITYTTKVPSAANFPNASADTGSGAPQLIINPETGVFYAGAATSGAGAGIVFGDGSTTGPLSADWARLRQTIAGKPVDIVYLAGWKLNPQYAAVIKDTVEWAVANRMRVVTAAPDDVGRTTGANDQFDSYVDGDTLGDVVTYINNDAVLHAAYAEGTGGTGRDYGAAFAALVAALGQSGSTKLKSAPGVVPFDPLQEFLPSQVGDLTAPATNTLHQIGVNAIVFTANGQPIWSHGRSGKTYDNTGTFATLANLFSYRGRRNRFLDYLQKAVVQPWIADAPDSGLFKDSDLEDLRDRIVTAGTTLFTEGTLGAPITSDDVVIPSFAETTSSDRALGILNGSSVSYLIGTEVLRVNLEEVVSF